MDNQTMFGFLIRLNHTYYDIFYNKSKYWTDELAKFDTAMVNYEAYKVERREK